MSQDLQNFAKFKKIQLDNPVDFEKCCKTHIYLQKSVPIQPKTSNILAKFCQKLATTYRPRGRRRPPPPPPKAAAQPAGRLLPRELTDSFSVSEPGKVFPVSAIGLLRIPQVCVAPAEAAKLAVIAWAFTYAYSNSNLERTSSNF